MNNVAVITGAGSGMGRAIALRLCQQGWQVAIVGRRAKTLKATARLAGARASRIRPFICDVSDPGAVAAMGRRVLAQFGGVEVLVNSAGTNAPRRSLEVLSLEDYHAMIATNLNGAYYCLQAFLPQMRARKSGTVVNIISDAGKLASAKAGAAYVASKFGLVGLTQSINAEERANGIRACAILPGDTDTPILNKRSQRPSAAARAKMLRPEDVADCAVFCINLPPHVIVEELLVRPR